MKDSLYDRIEVAAVTVGPRHRVVDEQRVQAMMGSLGEIGLKTPISVRVVNDGEEVQLVAGLHRLEAVRRLGWRDIDIRIEEGDALDAELWEIDENLMRAELSPSERAAHLARRKAIYEEKHQETKQGGAPGKPGGGKVARDDKLSSFAEDAATKTGRDKRTVQRDTARGEKIDPAVLAELRGTDMDKGTVLDELAATPREQQGEKLTELKRRKDNRDTLRKAGDAIVKADANEAFAQLLIDWLPAERLADAIEAADACGYSKLTAAIRRAQIDAGGRTDTDRPVFDNTGAGSADRPFAGAAGRW